MLNDKIEMIPFIHYSYAIITSSLHWLHMDEEIEEADRGHDKSG
jgi:hypothetical protein